MPPDVEIAGGAGAASQQHSRLSPNHQLGGGRYRVTQFVRAGTFGEIYRATDTQTETPLSLYLLDASLGANPTAAERVRAALERVSALQHKNLLQLQPLAAEGKLLYVVAEWVDGHALTELIARKRQAASVFTPKGAYNVIAHVCNALEAAHATLGHGALYPGNVLVNRAGRVKVSELGFGAAVPSVVARTPAAAYAAPEVINGGAPTPASDVYATGAILYELVTGVVPAAGSPPPSKVTLGLPAALDHALARACARDPGQRFGSMAELKQAVHDAIAGASATVQPRAAAAPAVAKRPSLAQQLSTDQQAQLASARPSGSQSAAAALTDTNEKYLVHKNRMDFGPFSLAQIVHQIETDQIQPGSYLIDNETGDRVLVEEHPLLAELVEHAKHRRDEQRRAQAEIQHAKSERRRGGMLYVVIAAGIAALGGGAYFAVGALSDDTDSGERADITLVQEGGYQAKITRPSAPKRSKRGGKRVAGPGGGSGAGNDEWDNQDLGDVSEDSGGDERLDVDTDINPVIQKHGGKLARCLSGGSRSAHIQFIVKGSGKVSYVRVNGATSGPLHKCIDGAMRSMTFPTFNGSRTRAEFEISR